MIDNMYLYQVSCSFFWVGSCEISFSHRPNLDQFSLLNFVTLLIINRTKEGEIYCKWHLPNIRKIYDAIYCYTCHLLVAVNHR